MSAIVTCSDTDEGHRIITLIPYRDVGRPQAAMGPTPYLQTYLAVTGPDWRAFVRIWAYGEWEGERVCARTLIYGGGA